MTNPTVSQRVQAIELREGDTILNEDGAPVKLGRVSWEPLHSGGGPVTAVRACVHGATVPTLWWAPDQRVARVQGAALAP